MRRPRIRNLALGDTMRRIVATLHTVYIAVVTACLVSAVYYGGYKSLFASDVAWAIHTAVSVLLIFVGSASVVALILKPEIAPIFQILWWIPQLLKVEHWSFSPDKTEAVFRSLYHYPSGFVFAVQVGFRIDPNVYMFAKLNLVALCGLLLAVAFLMKRRASGDSFGVSGSNELDGAKHGEH